LICAIYYGARISKPLWIKQGSNLHYSSYQYLIVAWAQIHLGFLYYEASTNSAIYPFKERVGV